MSLNRLPLLKNQQIAQALKNEIKELRMQALALCRKKGGLRHGADYVVAARPKIKHL